MSGTVEVNIWKALEARIEGLQPSYEVAWPARKSTPPSSGGKLLPYLRVGFVSAPPDRILIASGKPHNRVGALMVTLVYPLGQDLSVYEQIAGKIAAHFVDGTAMSYGGVCVTVTSAPHVQDGYEDNGYWSIPVRVPWQCFA